MKNRRVRSLADLKKARMHADLADGIDCAEKGNFKDATQFFNSVKDLTGLEVSLKAKIKDAYYCRGKELQYLWNLNEARACFEKARNIDINDIALLARIKLLQNHRVYRTPNNIGKFREMLKEGFTVGRYGSLQYPFVELADKYELIQEPEYPIYESDKIEMFLCIGIYQKQWEGRHMLSTLIRRYKRFAHPELAYPFAWLLADIIRSRTELLKQIDIIVPMPSNPNNQVERGFTPCLLIAQELSACLAVPYYELFTVAAMNYRFRDMSYNDGMALIRHKSGQTQSIPKERNVLLIDDVATTGRTLSLFTSKMKESGAKNVYAITLAKTGRPKQ